MLFFLFTLVFSVSRANGQAPVAPSTFACSTLAAPSCESKAKPLLDSMKSVCEATRTALNCDQLAKAASPSEKARFFSCDNSVDLCEQIEGAGHSRIYGCAEGFGGVIYEFGKSVIKIPWDLYHLPSTLRNLPRLLSDCPRSIADKKLYLGAIKPTEMTDETLARMSCIEMQKFARLKVDVIMAQIEARRQNQIAATGNDQLRFNYEDLSPKEKHAVDFDLQTTGPLGKARCYRPEEAAKATCYELGNLAVKTADVYMGGKGAVKFLRSMVPLEAAGIAAREGRYETIKMSRMNRGEETGNAMRGLKVRYLTETEQATKRLHFKNGRIYDSLGQPLNVKAATFIMDADGTFYASTDVSLKHSSLVAGGRVAAAGTMAVEDGQLVRLSRDSGHYEPGEFYLKQALTELKSNNIDTSLVKVVDLDYQKDAISGGRSESIGVPAGLEESAPAEIPQEK